MTRPLHNGGGDAVTLDRRTLLRTLAGAAATALPLAGLAAAANLKGRINQSVCLWCYSGYQGYVGQEFIPKRPDALASLEQAVRICDV